MQFCQKTLEIWKAHLLSGLIFVWSDATLSDEKESDFVFKMDATTFSTSLSLFLWTAVSYNIRKIWQNTCDDLDGLHNAKPLEVSLLIC